MQSAMLSVLTGCFIMAASTASAFATSGSGCFQVQNVESWDVLNIRAARSAKSKIIGIIPPQGHGIIALEGPCLPTSVTVNRRWCPIGYYDGDAVVHGFVKRRYLDPSECP
jgi:hypothetical protein